MLKRLVLPAALVLLGCGCGASDRPSTSDPMIKGGTEVTPVEVANGEPGTKSRVCEPLSYQDCKVTYMDESGQMQCPTQVQICNADGTAWLECGAYVYDENGEPQHRGTH